MHDRVCIRVGVLSRCSHDDETTLMGVAFIKRDVLTVNRLIPSLRIKATE